ncbi:MAG: hypothetical protein H7039_06805, partial [Bryobacteraceae bacterium]|nr:hypothetical protein [Bryobacteraceae bacterium]
LDEERQDAWLPELKRILKPGGVFVMTVHGRRVASALGPNGLQFLQQDGLVHRTTTKLNGIMPEWYNTSWHSQDYITQRLEGLFNDVRYVAILDGMQDFVIAR